MITGSGVSIDLCIRCSLDIDILYIYHYGVEGVEGDYYKGEVN